MGGQTDQKDGRMDGRTGGMLNVSPREGSTMTLTTAQKLQDNPDIKTFKLGKN